jgi:pseudouridine kinase
MGASFLGDDFLMLLEYLCRMSDFVICIGASLVDEIFYCKEKAIGATSNPATSERFAGGVMGNTSRMLAHLGLPVKLISVLGDDADGQWLKTELKKSGLHTDLMMQTVGATGKYVSILQPDGSMFVSVCSDQTDLLLTPAFFIGIENELKSAKMLVADANLSVDCLEWLCDFSRRFDVPLILEPVSVIKARKLAQINLNGVFMVTPNLEELESMFLDESNSGKDLKEHLIQLGVKRIWVRMGERGSLLKSSNENWELSAIHTTLLDSTGAGDAALAGWIAGWHKGWSEALCMKAGHVMAHVTLQQKGAVVEHMNENQFTSLIQKIYPDAF